MLALGSCAGGDRSFPTTGLTLDQVRSARFLEKEAVVDLRLAPPVVNDALASPEPERHRLGEGWFGAERSGRWGVGERTTLSIVVSDPTDLHLVVESRGPEAESVQVVVNGVDVGLMRPGEDWGTHRFTLDSGVLQVGQNETAFVVRFPSDRPPFRLRHGDPERIVREILGELPP